MQLLSIADWKENGLFSAALGVALNPPFIPGSSDAAFVVLPSPWDFPVAVIIFDFDGTIADSFDAVLQITNRLAREFGYAPASPEEIKRYQNLNSREILRQSQIPFYQLPFLLRRLKQEMRQDIDTLKPIGGIREALLTIKAQGHTLGIVTSNTEENVRRFLRSHQLDPIFDFLHSGVTLFGKGRTIQRLLRQNHLNPDSVVYVGDETRDIEAARAIKIRVIAVGWGFNSALALSEAQPDDLVLCPQDLVQAIAALPTFNF